MLVVCPTVDKNKIRCQEINAGVFSVAKGSNASFGGLPTRLVITNVGPAEQRRQVNSLHSMASALRPISSRDTLLLAGDFNARLHAVPGLIGDCSTTVAQVGLQDEGFQRFVESQKLIALDTWCSGRGSTYIQGNRLPLKGLPKYQPRPITLGWASGRNEDVCPFRLTSGLSGTGISHQVWKLQYELDAHSRSP